MLAEWAINSNYVGENTVVSLLKRIRAGELTLVGDASATQQKDAATTETKPKPSPVISESQPINPDAVVSLSAANKVVLQSAPPVLVVAETVSQDTSVAQLLAKIAAMEAREKEREAEHLTQKSESEKNRKKLAEMERKMKKLDVLQDVFGLKLHFNLIKDA